MFDRFHKSCFCPISIKPAWLLLAEMSEYCDRVDPKIIVQYWYKHIDADQIDCDTVARILSILCAIASRIPKDMARDLLGIPLCDVLVMSFSSLSFSCLHHLVLYSAMWICFYF